MATLKKSFYTISSFFLPSEVYLAYARSLIYSKKENYGVFFKASTNYIENFRWFFTSNRFCNPFLDCTSKVSQNERAAANLARMDASVQGQGSPKPSETKADSSKFLKELKGQQAKQIEYLTILVMILGIGSLGYSFIKKKEQEA